MIVHCYDYIIIGGGIIGLAMACRLLEKDPGASIAILEKESDVARHASGRNSGVLHAGFYYTADSLKARFTAEGNRRLTAYCHDNKLKINKCKKVVVARDETELPALYELEKRGKQNGVEVAIIDEKEARELDPNVRTHQYALYSPATSTVDPVEISMALKRELQDNGVRFFWQEAYARRVGKDGFISSRNNRFAFGKLINTAGLYADKVAADFGFSRDYTIIPFKGLYLKYTGNKPPVKTNVYPVPNLKNPFLGVHFTVTVDGSVKIGPTSMPAFWREHYDGFRNCNPGEAMSILRHQASLFAKNSFGFRSLARDEIKKMRKNHFIGMAAGMVHELDTKGFREWGQPGIRAQLLNIHTRELVMDFVVEGDDRSTHILNAVSPALTCSFPFAEWVVKNHVLPELMMKK